MELKLSETHPEMRHDIHIHNAFDVLWRTLLEGHQRYDSGIIDKDVHCPQISFHIRVQFHHLFVFADVSLDDKFGVDCKNGFSNFFLKKEKVL